MTADFDTYRRGGFLTTKEVLSGYHRVLGHDARAPYSQPLSATAHTIGTDHTYTVSLGNDERHDPTNRQA